MDAVPARRAGTARRPEAGFVATKRAAVPCRAMRGGLSRRAGADYRRRIQAAKAIIRGSFMNVLEMLEGGGLLIVCALVVAFVLVRREAAGGDWPAGILSTNGLVLLILSRGFFGPVTRKSVV